MIPCKNDYMSNATTLGTNFRGRADYVRPLSPHVDSLRVWSGDNIEDKERIILTTDWWCVGFTIEQQNYWDDNRRHLIEWARSVGISDDDYIVLMPNDPYFRNEADATLCYLAFR